MKDYNEFAGVFRWGHGGYTFHNLDYIKFVINTIFHNCEHQNSSDFAEVLFEKVDDFAYCGCYESWDKDGCLNSTYLFAIMVNHKVGVIDQNMNQLIAPEYNELIPPIHSDAIFVLQDNQGKWGAINAFSNQVIINFGEYKKLWGFDYNHCLACNEYEVSYVDSTNRCIIDNKGRITIKPKEYYAIFPFYNTGVKYIVVQEKEIETNNCFTTNRHLNLLCKDSPRSWFHIEKESVEAPREYRFSSEDVDIPNKMDAYDGDYDALWNTD